MENQEYTKGMDIPSLLLSLLYNKLADIRVGVRGGSGPQITSDLPNVIHNSLVVAHRRQYRTLYKSIYWYEIAILKLWCTGIGQQISRDIISSGVLA